MDLRTDRSCRVTKDVRTMDLGRMAFRTFMFAKIHRATVTGANVDYVGSITIDAELLAASGIRPYERVQVVDVDNGERLETYVIAGAAGSGVIELNGAAARLVQIGDKVIIMAYAPVRRARCRRTGRRWCCSWTSTTASASCAMPRWRAKCAARRFLAAGDGGAHVTGNRYRQYQYHAGDLQG